MNEQQRAAMSLEEAARELLAHWDTINWKDGKMTADYMAALREALAQPQGEPVAWIDESDLRQLAQGNAAWAHPENQGRMVAVYLHQKTWVELQPKHRAEIFETHGLEHISEKVAQVLTAFENKLKELNCE